MVDKKLDGTPTLATNPASISFSNPLFIVESCTHKCYRHLAVSMKMLDFVCEVLAWGCLRLMVLSRPDGRQASSVSLMACIVVAHVEFVITSTWRGVGWERREEGGGGRGGEAGEEGGMGEGRGGWGRRDGLGEGGGAGEEGGQERRGGQREGGAGEEGGRVGEEGGN